MCSLCGSRDLHVGTADLKFGHIGWRNECLRVIFASTKADQVGADAEKTAKHCYAVPMNPVICPVFALAVWVFNLKFCEKLRQTHS